MCGVLGAIGRRPVAGDLYCGARTLVHRGPNAWGLGTIEPDGRPRVHRAGGLPAGFDPTGFGGAVGVAHARNATTADKRALVDDAQPLVCDESGLLLVFNGHLDVDDIRADLEASGMRFATNNDGEVLLGLLRAELAARGPACAGGTFDGVLAPAVAAVMDRLRGRGAYSAVGTLGAAGLFGFRDPNGIRPLVLATGAGHGLTSVLASETVAVSAVGAFNRVREVARGEVVLIAPDGAVRSAVLRRDRPALCALEPVYLSAAKSRLGGTEVAALRRRLGVALARRFNRLREQIDLVVPVPATAVPIGEAVAAAWGKPWGGMDRAVEVRSFLQATPADRRGAVGGKFTYLPALLGGRSIAVVDDSIIRGTTVQSVTDGLREAGATAVHWLVAFPPVTDACRLGIDIPSDEHLFAVRPFDPAAAVGADSINYLTAEDVREALSPIGPVCLGCTGDGYPPAAGCEPASPDRPAGGRLAALPVVAGPDVLQRPGAT
jgi:amidophosphoribosyltransferase